MDKEVYRGLDTEGPESPMVKGGMGEKAKSGGLTVFEFGPCDPFTHGFLPLVLSLEEQRIVHADPQLGYLHRGIEKIAEHMTYTQFIPYTDHLDYLAPLANNVAYALAVERLLGIERQIPARAQFIRVICCELSRISSHLFSLGVCARALGLVWVFSCTVEELEKIYDLWEWLTGNRCATSFTRIGGIARDLPEGWAQRCREVCRSVLSCLRDVELLLSRNPVWRQRTEGIGVIPANMAVDYGLTGPSLRASGVAYDVRKARPYLVYDQLEFDVPVGEHGDCLDRYLVRVEEIRQSVRIIDQCLRGLPDGPVRIEDGKITPPPKAKVKGGLNELIHHFMLFTQDVQAPPAEVYFGAENPKGELGFYIYSCGGGVPYRLKIRSPSFCNLSVLPALLRGASLNDVAAILASLDFVMTECDR